MRTFVDNLCAMGTLLIFLAAPFWCGYVLIMDLIHPELWDRDPFHDPRFYLPLMAVVLPLCVLAWRNACLEYRRQAERLEESRQRLRALKRGIEEPTLRHLE